VVWTWRRSRPAAFCLLWLAAVLGPVANLVPVTTRPIAEQRLFAATIPFAILVGLALGRLGALWFVEKGVGPAASKGSDPFFRAIAATVLAAAWLIATGAATAVALPTWRDELTLWGRTARRSPTSWRAQYNCATALLRAGDYPAAVAQLERTLRLDDLQEEVLQNLTYCLLHMGRREEARAAARLALSWRPDYADPHGALALALLREGRIQPAIHEARIAVRLNPRNGGHHAALGYALLEADRGEEAIGPLRRASELRPYDARLRLVLVDALERTGRLEEAVAECEAIIARWPGRRPAAAARARARRIRMGLPRS
jgi:tetratricopeptide (TPR) repeat protein